MPWKPNTPETISLLEAAVVQLPCEKRQMFGCPVYFANGSMFAGVHENRIFLRLSVPDRELLRAEHPEAHPFEPLAGRVMRQYLVIPATLSAEAAALGAWLARAHGYAAALPPKVRKGRGGGRAR